MASDEERTIIGCEEYPASLHRRLDADDRVLALIALGSVALPERRDARSGASTAS
jgi:hypothetical protein